MSSFLKQFNKRHHHGQNSIDLLQIDRITTETTTSSMSIPRVLPTPMELSVSPPTKNSTFKNWFSDWSTSHNNKKDVLINDSQKILKSKIFGISLKESLQRAKCEIVMSDTINNKIFGYVPVVIAKSGSIIKQDGIVSSGIFRISGNKKKIDFLIKNVFNIAPYYGLDFNYDENKKNLNFTINDFTSVFKFYLNNLEEPVIPYRFFVRFIEILKTFPEMIKFFDLISDQTINSKDKNEIKTSYENYDNDSKELLNLLNQIIIDLPRENKDLFIYILDLLSMIRKRSVINLMTSENLSIVFQPSILSHEQFFTDIEQNKLARYILRFLIENFDALIRIFYNETNM